MQFRNRLSLSLLIAVLFPAIVPTAFADDSPKESAPAAPIPRIDQEGVHDEYVNGNFETVVQRIDAFRKENPVHSRDDSIFIARHLAVVFAANPLTVEAGKHWMRGLLSLSPDADLSGMYVSAAIERMFLDVGKEEEARAGAGRPSHRRWLWLGAGGTAIAATAIVVWVAFTAEAENPKPPTVVPVNL
jgi:hypothetical protein